MTTLSPDLMRCNEILMDRNDSPGQVPVSPLPHHGGVVLVVMLLLALAAPLDVHWPNWPGHSHRVSWLLIGRWAPALVSDWLLLLAADGQLGHEVTGLGLLGHVLAGDHHVLVLVTAHAAAGVVSVLQEFRK